MTLIFAHRGSAGTHPENTMVAFKEAERVGADGIELDVQLTKDGEVVIIHDDKVDRTTDGKGLVKDMNLADIQKLNAGARFQNGKYKAKIPTLNEFLSWLKGTSLVCNIEYKSSEKIDQLLVEKTVALVRNYELENSIIFSSFNHYTIVHSYRVAPEIEIAPLYMEGIYMPWIYAESIQAKGIHPHYKVMPNELVEMSQGNGISVRPFTVNNEKDLQRFFKAKTAAIITDYPEKAVKLRDHL